MKTGRIITTAVACTILLTSCEELVDQLGFDVNTGYYETEIVVPPTLANTPLLFEQLLEVDIDSIIDAQQKSGVIVKSIEVAGVLLEIQAGSKVPDFNALDEVEVFLSTRELSKEAIASYTNNTMDASSLLLDPVSLDVSEYLEQSPYTLTTSATLKQDLADTLRFSFKIKYKIEMGFEIQE